MNWFVTRVWKGLTQIAHSRNQAVTAVRRGSFQPRRGKWQV
jgi:hypothetical protein